jgi:hypothetical protein
MPVASAYPDSIPFDEAIQLAVAHAWGELAGTTFVRGIRVEYRSDPGVFVDHVTVWLVKPGGYQDCACDYWIQASCQLGCWHWGDGIYSARLANAFEFILENQGKFRHMQTAIPARLIVVFPPTQDAQAKAEAWATTLPTRDRYFHAAGL